MIFGCGSQYFTEYVFSLPVAPLPLLPFVDTRVRCYHFVPLIDELSRIVSHYLCEMVQSEDKL